MTKSRFVELSTAEIYLIILSLGQTQDYLQAQKGDIGGALMGFSKIDEMCKAAIALQKKLRSIDLENMTDEQNQVQV